MIGFFHKFYLCSLLVLLNQEVKANQLFVATNGSNTNSGSFTQPLASIQHALDIMAIGDTVWVRSGMYNEKLVWKTGGSPLKTALLSAYQNEQVVIDGTNQTALAMLYIDTKSYIKIQKLCFQQNYGQDAEGIHIIGTASHITIDRCKVKNIGWSNNANADPYSVNPSGQSHGIIVNGRSMLGIKHISVTNCHLSNLVTGNSEALTLVGNVDSFLIDRDTVTSTKNIGIVAAGHYSWAVDPGVPASLSQSRNGTISHCLVVNNRRFSNVDAPAGIYVDGGRNIQVFNNWVYQNGNGLSLGCENGGSSTASDVSFYNNVVFDNDNHGIVFGANTGLVKKSLLRNNTFFQNGTIQNWTSEISIQNTDSCQIFQNILIPISDLHYAASIFGYSTTNMVFDNNLAYRYSGNQNDLIYTGSPVQFTATNTLMANPLLASPFAPLRNFSLNAGSPAINVGQLIYGFPSTLDALGGYRLVNGKVDAGAIENQNGGCPGSLNIDAASIWGGLFTASSQILFSGNQPFLPGTASFAPSVSFSGIIPITDVVLVSGSGCN
ncbi:MAG: hypothetical protein IPK46_22440 [Saprospiraceae bacterium]|nr:hypothetical protein [Saprospiraceae bacterium]